MKMKIKAYFEINHETGNLVVVRMSENERKEGKVKMRGKKVKCKTCLK